MHDTDRRDGAIRALIDREPATAAERYALVGHGAFAGLEAEGRDTYDPGRSGWVGHALKYLLLAGAAHRAAGADTRAARVCHAGRLLATDLRDHAFEYGVQRAVAEEFRGDFGVVGGEAVAGEGGGGAYDRAAAAYREAAVEDPVDWATTPLFSAATEGASQIARNGPAAFQWDELHGDDPASPGYLAHRAEYKSRRLPRAVAAVAESGVLHPPRGSTEHNNDAWVCPVCGRGEVNFVAGERVCIDHSRRLERR